MVIPSTKSYQMIECAFMAFNVNYTNSRRSPLEKVCNWLSRLDHILLRMGRLVRFRLTLLMPVQILNVFPQKEKLLAHTAHLRQILRQELATILNLRRLDTFLTQFDQDEFGRLGDHQQSFLGQILYFRIQFANLLDSCGW